MHTVVWVGEIIEMTPAIWGLLETKVKPHIHYYSPATEILLRVEEAVLNELCGPMGRVIA